MIGRLGIPSTGRYLASLSVTIAALISVNPALAQGPLRIVVIEGEDQTNIVQQRTAVAPVIEVRDRNDQPVAGVVITFGIRRGSAQFANGSRTLVATTDAAGRAVGTGLTPTGSGAVQISVSARVQGQVVSATITQTNVATAAQAGQAGVSSTGGGGASGTGGTAGAGGAAGAGATTAAAGGAGGGASGGLSGLAIGGIAAGAGGAAVAVAVTRGNEQAAPASVTYSGQYSGQFVLTTNAAFATNPSTCVSTRNVTGILTMALTVTSGGAVSGTSQTTIQQAGISDVGCSIPFTSASLPLGDAVSGTANSLTMTARVGVSGNVFLGPISGSTTLTFTGTLSGNIITGNLVFAQNASGTTDGSNGRPAGAPITQSGSVSMTVTLR